MRYYEIVAGRGLQRPGSHCTRLIVAASQISTTKKSTKQDADPVFYLRNPVTQNTGGPGFQVRLELSVYEIILVLHKLLQDPSIVRVPRVGTREGNPFTEGLLHTRAGPYIAGKPQYQGKDFHQGTQSRRTSKTTSEGPIRTLYTRMYLILYFFVHIIQIIDTTYNICV